MINTYDIETYNEKDMVIPYCVCFNINNNDFFVYFGDHEDIIYYSLEIIIKTMESDLIDIYIHNLNFDGRIILESLTKRKIKFSIFNRKNDIFFIDVTMAFKKIRFKCSYKLLPMSLKNLSEYSSVTHKKKFPYKFVNANNLFYIGKIPDKSFWNYGDYDLYLANNKNCFPYNIQNETISYCFTDVHLLKKTISNIYNVVDNSHKFFLTKALTTPSLSHKIFYKFYNYNNISEKMDMDKDYFTRKSYFGGRTEVFGNIKKNEYIKYYDFSGMYGQCMLEHFHNGKSYFKLNADYNEVGFHTIKYYSNIDYIPILPTKNFKNKLIFANGENEGTFWFEEIQLFVKNGGVVKEVMISLVYERYEMVFDKFIEDFTKIRIHGGYYKLFGKLIINSLYGGLGLKDDNDLNYITTSDEEYSFIVNNFNVISESKLNSTYFLRVANDYKLSIKNGKNLFNMDKNKLSKRNISYASAITSKARIRLYNMFKTIIEDGGRLLYCDTDSIFAAYPISDARKKFKDNIWLNFYDDGIFILPKVYAVKNDKEDVIKIKGVFIENESFSSIKEKFTKNISIEFSNQLTFNKKNFSIKQSYLNKEILLTNYDKRIFINDKSDTIPIIL